MTICAVAGCKSNNDKKLIKNPENSSEIIFNRFPRDEKLRKVWLQRCGLKGDCKAKRLYVCIKHFTPADYVRNLRHKPWSYFAKSCRKVRIDAIPSLFLPPYVVIPPEPAIVKETKKPPEKKEIPEKNPNTAPSIDVQATQFEFIDHVVMAYLNRCRSRAGNANIGMPNYILKAKAQEAAILLGAKYEDRFHWIEKFKEKLAEKDAKGVILTSVPESLSISDIINDEWPKFADEKGLDIDHHSEDTISANTEESPMLTENETLGSKNYQRQSNEQLTQIENLTSYNVEDGQTQYIDATASNCSRYTIVEKTYQFTQSQTSQKQNNVYTRSEIDPQEEFLRHVLSAFINRYNASWPQADIPETVLNAKFKEAAKILGLIIKYKNVWLFEFKRSINHNNEAILTEPNQSLDICDIINEERPKFDSLNVSSITQDCELKEVVTVSETNIVDKCEQYNIECCDSIQTYEEARDCLSLLNNYALELGDRSALSLIEQVDSFLRSDDFEE